MKKNILWKVTAVLCAAAAVTASFTACQKKQPAGNETSTVLFENTTSISNTFTYFPSGAKSDITTPCAYTIKDKNDLQYFLDDFSKLLDFTQKNEKGETFEAYCKQYMENYPIDKSLVIVSFRSTNDKSRLGGCSISRRREMMTIALEAPAEKSQYWLCVNEVPRETIAELADTKVTQPK